MSVVGPYAARHPSPLRRLSKPSRPTNAYPPPIIPPPPPDPFYGHRETAELCQRFIRALFACPDRPPPSTSSPQSPTPPLALFVAYALHRTRLHPSVTFTALFLLSRLKSRFPAARGSSGHRLFISAFMIASKVVCDDTYSNKSWTVVGQGMFSLREINQMEREMCGYLEWFLNVPPSDLHDFEARVRKEYAPGAPCPPFVHPPLPASSTPSSSSTTNATSGTTATSSSAANSSVGAAADIPLPPSTSSSSSPEHQLPHSSSSSHHHNHNHQQSLPSPPLSPRHRGAARAPTIPPAAPTLRPISVPGSVSISTMVSVASTASSSSSSSGSGGSTSGRPATPQLGPREDDSPSPASSTTCLTPQSDDDEPDDATIVSMGGGLHGELSAVADSSTAVGSSVGVGGGSAVASVVGVSGPTRTSSALSFVSAASLPPKSKAGRDPSFAFPSRTVW